MRQLNNQAAESLRAFVSRLPHLIWNTQPEPSPLPQPPLVIRVAAAGHLHIPSPASLQHAFNEVFAGLRDYALRINQEFLHSFDNRELAREEEPELRVVCQLAPGVDQMAALTALELGYALHVVLPASQDAFERDIKQLSVELLKSGLASDNMKPNSVSACRDLLKRASRILEMDPPLGAASSTGLSDEAYSQASSVILDHSDIVVIAVHENGSDHPGGTKWMERQAQELNLPVVRVPIDQPSKAILSWTKEGRRETRFLFNSTSEGLNSSIFDLALSQNLLLQGGISNPYQAGWFENRIINQLFPEFNARIWEKRWTLPNIATALAQHSLGQVPSQVDCDLKRVKVWADHRASAMAEIVRGSFIVCSILGSVAVFAAIIGALWHNFDFTGKIIEIVCLLIVLCFIKRSNRRAWRAQWLSSRQLERAIEQAAWLLMLGRTPSFMIPAHSQQLQANAPELWTNWYLRAVLRSASFPTAQLDTDYVMTVHELALHNLVTGQIRYYESEEKLYRRADEFLHTLTNRCVFFAFVVTLAYLVALIVWPYLAHVDLISRATAVLGSSFTQMQLVAANLAVIISILMPAVAASVAAVRNHGEYSQVAARYEGIAQSLKQIEFKLLRTLPDDRQGESTPRLGSLELVTLLHAATSSLFQEVVGWQSILQNKRIEPT